MSKGGDRDWKIYNIANQASISRSLPCVNGWLLIEEFYRFQLLKVLKTVQQLKQFLLEKIKKHLFLWKWGKDEQEQTMLNSPLYFPYFLIVLLILIATTCSSKNWGLQEFSILLDVVAKQFFHMGEISIEWLFLCPSNIHNTCKRFRFSISPLPSFRTGHFLYWRSIFLSLPLGFISKYQESVSSQII